MTDDDGTPIEPDPTKLALPEGRYPWQPDCDFMYSPDEYGASG